MKIFKIHTKCHSEPDTGRRRIPVFLWNRFFTSLRSVQNDRRKQSGVTLIEMIVVVAIATLLATLAIPAIRTFLDSMATQGSTRAMIGAALSSARAVAVKEHRYAGIRFQKIYDPDDPVNSPQYMIFIIHDYDKTGLANGFRAMEKIKPIKFPDAIGVMDINAISNNGDIDTNTKLSNATTFSIVFSPSGKLVIHDVRAQGKSDEDDIFNSASNIENGTGMFVVDPFADQEPSRKNFVLYDREEFKKISDDKRWSKYLQKLKLVNINTYTGRLISTD